jgi:hypothetical protein
MIHTQGTLLDPRGQIRFENLDIYIATGGLPGGGGAWVGYFDPPTASGLITGETFGLILEDGRRGDILIQGVRSKGEHAPRILFSAERPLR